MKIKKTVVTKSTTPTAAAKTLAKKAGRTVVNAKQESASTSASAGKKAVTVAEGMAALRNGINFGKTTGMRVMAFQDATLATNDQPKRSGALAHIPGQLSDTELAKVWREEFPNSRAVQAGRINEDIVRGVRNLFNQGTQGHGTPGQTHQSRPWIVGENGRRVQIEYTRARKAVDAVKGTTAKAAKVSAEADVAATKKAAKSAAKVVTGAAAKAVKTAKTVAGGHKRAKAA